MSADYLAPNQPDILEVIANLSNDAVFTPPRVVNAVLDLLPAEVWSDPSLRWLDPGAKTGVFPREITKRLMIGLAEAIPDETARLEHILREMVFAIATEEITGMMTRRSLYCSKDASSEFSTVRFADPSGNVWQKRVKHDFDIDGRCRECKGSKDQLLQPGRDNKAYGFIHADGRKQIDKEMDMKFDVIVGNPPYQVEDEGFGRSSSPLYQEFVQRAIELNPSFVLMVVPSRWMGGGKGLDAFRKMMLTDSRLAALVDFENSQDVFPAVDIAGGICYFLWDASHGGPCLVKSVSASGEDEEKRLLSEFDVFVRSNRAVDVVRRVISQTTSFMSELVSARKPFGLDTTVRPEKSGDLVLRWQGGEGPFPHTKVTTGEGIISKWKVVASYAGFDHAGAPDKEGTRRVLSVVTILGPGTICNETYVVVGSFDSEKEAESLVSYMRTCFFRFLLSQRMYSQHLTRAVYGFVPQQTWDREWTDSELFKKYQVTAEEQSYIRSVIREMPT